MGMIGYIALRTHPANHFAGSLFRNPYRRNEAVMRWLVAGDQSARDVVDLPAPTVAELIEAGALYASEDAAIGSVAVAADEYDDFEILEVSNTDIVEAMTALVHEHEATGE